MNDIERKINEGRLKIVRLEDDLYVSAEALMPSGIFINPIIERFISMVKQAFNKAGGS